MLNRVASSSAGKEGRCLGGETRQQMEQVMKTTGNIFLPFICATIIAWGSNLPAQEAATNDAPEFPPGEGLRLDFRDAKLDEVLGYMSQAAGFVIYFKPGVRVDGTVTVLSEQPLSKEEAVNLLKTVLSDHGCSVIQNGRTLTLVNTVDIHTETRIKLGADPAAIPRDVEVVTQIIPVRNLNPLELSKILTPLLPAGAMVTVDESANSLLLTDTQADVHRAAEIIAALDSVSSSANTLKVYPLQFADAKSLADLIKQLFSPPDSGRSGANNNNNNATGNFLRVPGGARGFNPGNAAPDTGQTPVSRISAVADEHGNAVIVSAPEAMLPGITTLIAEVDVPVDDIASIQVFPLENADPVEMAGELADLFPNDTSSADASSTQIQFRGQGGRGGQTVGARQGQAENTGAPSDRVRKLGNVLAVPDPRTSSLMVSAAKSLMPQIAAVVKELDARAGNRQRTHVIQINSGEGANILRVIQQIYPAGTVSTASTSQTDPLDQRATTMWNNQSSSGIGSGVAASQPGGSATGRNGALP